MSMTLHHCMSARSLRPLWTLEELGLDYELVMHPFPPRVMNKSYLGINVLGTVPAFVHGDVFMTESSAISQYLADLHPEGGLSVDKTDPMYGEYLNALHYGEATLTFPQTLVLRYKMFEKPERRQPQVAEDYANWFLARLRRAEAIVSERPYFCGERFTVADISVGYALLLGESIGLHTQYPEHVARYWSGLKQRAGLQRALEAEKNAARSQGLSTKSPMS
tara:strand:- start:851 stop:1513 length:663 start_codon:yes stop_codon:yes gene_type:complete